MEENNYMKFMSSTSLIVIGLFLTIGLLIMFKHDRKTTNAWLKYVETTAAVQPSGILTATDKTGTEILLEWKIMNARSTELLTTMKNLSEFMVRTWTPIEVDYLKAHPEEVMEKDHLKYFRPLFASGIEHVNWREVGSLMAQLIKSMIETDPKDFFGEHDVSIFVVAKDKATNEQLGFVQYLVKQEYPYGTVNLGNLAVEEKARNRGLGKLLASSIFKLLPKTERIFLYTRTTNEVAQKAYSAYGFKLSKKPITDQIFAKGWLMFEYDSKESDILQKTAHKLQH